MRFFSITMFLMPSTCLKVAVFVIHSRDVAFDLMQPLADAVLNANFKYLFDSSADQCLHLVDN